MWVYLIAYVRASHVRRLSNLAESFELNEMNIYKLFKLNYIILKSTSEMRPRIGDGYILSPQTETNFNYRTLFFFWILLLYFFVLLPAKKTETHLPLVYRAKDLQTEIFGKMFKKSLEKYTKECLGM
jgi:hypothetical protein